MKKIAVIFMILLSLSLCGCDKAGYEQTEATEQALETYYAAVKNSVAATKGEIKISIYNNDTIVDKKETRETYQYNYQVAEDGSEGFDYRCYDKKGTLLNHYKTDDEGKVIDQKSGAENENFEGYLTHKDNPISSLKMFRMDANYRVSHATISSIEMTQEGEKQILTVTYHGDKLTAQSIRNTGGLVRNITSCKRVYTIENNKISRIEIYTRTDARQGKEKGVMNTDTIVEVSYP